MSTCYIEFDAYNGCYLAGNIISGKVVCVFNSPKNVKGIYVKLKGDEKNSWTETVSHYDSIQKRHVTRHIYYTGHNRFLNMQTALMGSGDMEIGRYEFPFAFQLPNHLPSTYRGHHGGISYIVKANVSRSFKTDFTDAKIINVVCPIDLNTIRGHLQLNPVSYSDEKTVCCACCSSGLISMDVGLEKEAFAVGEVAKLRVKLINMSNENIEKVEVKLKMTTESRVTSPSTRSKYNSELLAANSDTGVGAHGERIYDFNLQIPGSTYLPNFALCSLFHQITRLKVKAIVPGCHGNLKISIPVTLGHIPISTTGNYYPSPPGYAPDYSNTISYIQAPVSGGNIGFASPDDIAGASAPPLDATASAPSKKEMAEGQSGFELPPPSYHEATSSQPKY